MNKQYYTVEHIWRFLRDTFVLVGTGIWLYTDISPHVIMLCFVMAWLINQFHGFICHLLEKMLHYKEQHKDWE